MKKCLRRNLPLKQVQAEGSSDPGRRNVRVFAAGLPRGSRHENSQEDKINLMEPIPAVLGELSLFLPGFSWSLRSRNKVIVKMSHVAPETECTAPASNEQ